MLLLAWISSASYSSPVFSWDFCKNSFCWDKNSSLRFKSSLNFCFWFLFCSPVDFKIVTAITFQKVWVLLLPSDARGICGILKMSLLSTTKVIALSGFRIFVSYRAILEFYHVKWYLVWKERAIDRINLESLLSRWQTKEKLIFFFDFVIRLKRNKLHKSSSMEDSPYFASFLFLFIY